jgi:alcohol dehydrogenase class IV
VVCQTLVRLAGTPHAQTNAVMLPNVVAFMASRAPDAIGRLAPALGSAREDPVLAAAEVARLAARSGFTRLSQLGVGASRRTPGAAVASESVERARTPGGATRDEVVALLARAL